MLLRKAGNNFKVASPNQIFTNSSLLHRSSRRSLPHKKRIPKKLKGVKSAMRCGKCGECFASQAELNTHRATHTKKQTAQQSLLNFSCQLCNKGFPTQIKFFEHLKAHYEPIQKQEDEDEQQPDLEQQQDHNVHHTELEEHLESKMTLPSVIVQELPPALPPPLACPHCNKVFRRQKAYDSHLSSAHGHIQVCHC
jgi:Zinc-finger double-stranded RNA-binding/Zinc finger, C2H2 type/C2H2-type zinc finger